MVVVVESIELLIIKINNKQYIYYIYKQYTIVVVVAQNRYIINKVNIECEM